jgi:hypothetical protein
MPSWPVGLDGAYRLFPGKFDLPMGLRGYWADSQTFVFEYDTIANNNHFIVRMQFEDSQVVVTAQEADDEVGVTFEGNLQTP